MRWFWQTSSRLKFFRCSPVLPVNRNRTSGNPANIPCRDGPDSELNRSLSCQFSELPNRWLSIKYHVHVWQVSSQLCRNHWSPTVPVSVWLPEPARDHGSKQETLNDDFYHTTSRSAAIFGVQTVLSYLVLTLNLWIGLCPVKQNIAETSHAAASLHRAQTHHKTRYDRPPCTPNITELRLEVW